MSSFLLLRLPGGVGVRVDARGGSRPPGLCRAARAGRGEGRHAHQLPLLHTCSSRCVHLFGIYKIIYQLLKDVFTHSSII
jgi:hypothetical protein